MNLLKRLLDPKTQIFIVGILSVVAGVVDYVSNHEFIQGYPELVSVLGTVAIGVNFALRAAKAIFLGGGFGGGRKRAVKKG